MTHVEGEPVLLDQHPCRPVEKVRVEVDDLAAHPTLDVPVAVPVNEVVRGGAVPEVDVLDRAEVGERLEGPVDTVPVDAGVELRHHRDDGLGAEVTVVAGQSREHDAAGPGHPLAAARAAGP